VVAVFFIFHVSLLFGSRTCDESKATLLAVNRLSTVINEYDNKYNFDVELLRDQLDINDVSITCCKLFNVKRNNVIHAILLTVYYIIITLQMSAITHH